MTDTGRPSPDASSPYGAFGRVRRLHFVGIGGAGMNGIAEVLLNLGYDVSGSDQAENAAVERLRELGATVHIGHDAAHIEGADAVVLSTAIGADNPERMAAQAQRLPMVRRAEMLAELMRFRYGIAVAGTHGKTTTTSLTASVLAEAGLDPTFVIGGLLNSAGTSARLGAGRYLVAEADESDASFLHLQPVLAVVTNIDADHLETYGGDFERLKASFSEFLQHLPFYGLAVLCADDSNLRELAKMLPRPVRTYALDSPADVQGRIVETRGPRTRMRVEAPVYDVSFETELNLPGRHNAANALAAITVALELHVKPEPIAHALAGFSGIGRRFQVVDDLHMGGGSVTLVDDYAHHPAELAAAMSAARDAWPTRRQVVVFQPHRYSRTRDLFDDFAAVLSRADHLLLAEVYAAGEAPITGADARSLCRAIRQRGTVEPVLVDPISELPTLLAAAVEDQDVVLMLGAGSIGQWAARIAAVAGA